MKEGKLTRIVYPKNTRIRKRSIRTMLNMDEAKVYIHKVETYLEKNVITLKLEIKDGFSFEILDKRNEEDQS